jgi:putative ABC transport system ATP-binding protein
VPETSSASESGGRITIRGLRKTYHAPGGRGRDVEAIRGLDLSIDEPGFHAVMGPSGSGKTTLLHLLAGLDRADAGSIEVAGERVDRLSERELTHYRRRRIGMVFQQFNLLPTLSALDNVMLPGTLDGQAGPRLRDRAAELLGELGLADRADHRPDALSGGEQQRVAIARALLFDPPVVFADEPTGNLDSATSERLWDLLNRIASERRMLVLMVTHEPEAATRCRRVFVLRDGTLAGAFDVDGLDSSGLAVRTAELARASA